MIEKQPIIYESKTMDGRIEMNNHYHYVGTFKDIVDIYKYDQEKIPKECSGKCRKILHIADEEK